MELAGGEGTGGVGTGGSRKSPRTPTRRRTGLAGGVRGVTEAFSSVRLSAERGTGKAQRCVHAADRKAEDSVSPGRGRPRCRDGLGAAAAPRAGGRRRAATADVPEKSWASRWEIKPGPRKDTPSKGAAGLGRNLEGAARLVCLPRPVRARKLCQPCSPRGHQNVSQELHENTQWQFRGKNMLR